MAIVLSVFLVAPIGANDQTPPSPGPEPSPTGGDTGVTGLAAGGPASILIYGPTSGGYADTTPGVTVTVWSAAVWATKSTADFAAFDAIVFGDQPECFEDQDAVWGAAVANKQAWSAAVSGNVIINGTDPDFHGKTQLVYQSVQFAAADEGAGPGMYVSLSCAYHYGENGDPVQVDLLSGIGSFRVRGILNNACPNDAHKVAEHPTLAGIDDAYLSNWGCSTHEVFDTWPTGYQPLAIIQDGEVKPGGTPYTAPDGETGLVYMIARGAASPCVSSGDSDGDCLPDTVEQNETHTDRFQADTDGDGLLDSWEVEGVQGAGFHIDGGAPIPMRDVFGSFGNGDLRACASAPEANLPELKIEDNFECLNRAPDPNHKDVFLEIDWQDCQTDYACPEAQLGPATFKEDRTHHAPNINALVDVIEEFDDAPVANPDGSNGVNLRILVDARVKHTPNCDRGLSSVREKYFGTNEQRASVRVIAAKAQAVRYVWSGHSSWSDDTGHPCPLPTGDDFLNQGFGTAPLVSYDESPFGSANLLGKDILVTLGPVWSCPMQIGPLSAPLQGGHLFGPCYREVNPAWQYSLGDPPFFALPFDPGIFPTKVRGEDPDDPTKPITERTQNYSLALSLGETEADGIRQLWARSLMHLLGHSLGIADEGSVGNQPSPIGRHQAGGQTLQPLRPDSFSSWAGLQYAPLNRDGTGLPPEAFANYDAIARGPAADADPDNDGVITHDDNCPNITNNQDNADDGPWSDLATDPGDACDFDLDGDGIRNDFGGSLVSASGAKTNTAAADDPLDQFPYDTDNDGTDNVTDPDDDGDSVLDATDRCRLTPDPAQTDTDGDGIGDFCDRDADGDGAVNPLEVIVGSNERDPLSRPEYVGSGGSCTNGVDDDRDGALDAADPGCVDNDGDGYANADDLCPSIANRGQLDRDGDGVGDICDLTVDIDWLRDATLPSPNDGTILYWSGSRDGTFTVRIGGTDCSTGSVIDSGTYDAGVFDPSAGESPQQALSVIESTDLAEGANTIRVCLLAGPDSASAERGITVTEEVTTPPDTTPPTVPAGLTATAVSSSRIDLAWIPATDNNGVQGYKVYRNGTFLATIGLVGSASFIDTGLGASTSYTYKVSAVDAAGNESAQSGAVTVSTHPTSDTTAPTAPTGVAASAAAWNQVTVFWNAASDNVGVTSYQVLRNGSLLAVVDGVLTSFVDRTTTPSGTFTYAITAKDAAGNTSATSASGSATTPTCGTCLSATVRPNADLGGAGFTPNSGSTLWTQLDETSPDGDSTYVRGPSSGTAQALTGMGAPPAGTAYQVTVRFNAKQYVSAGQPGTMNAHIELLNGAALIGTGATRSLSTSYATFTDTFSVSASAPSFRVRIVQDSAGTNKRTTRFSWVEAIVLYAPADTTSPSVPSGLVASARSTKTTALSWTPSTDAVGVRGYRVYRNGSVLGTVPVGSGFAAKRFGFASTGFIDSMTGGPASCLCGSGEGHPTFGDRQVLTWTGTWRDLGAPAGSVVTGAQLLGLDVSAFQYSHATQIDLGRVTLADANGGEIAVLFDGLSTGLDTLPLTKIPAQSAVAIGPYGANEIVKLNITTQVAPDANDVSSWQWNYDNVLVLPGIQGATSPTTFTDTGLVASTTYTYTVSAIDAAGNVSAQSTSAAATTHPTTDTTAPTAPTGVAASAAAWNQVTVSWNASSDNVGVTSYQVFRNGVRIVVVAGTASSFVDRTTQASTTYTYTIKAVDGAGNVSPTSSGASVTTP